MDASARVPEDAQERIVSDVRLACDQLRDFIPGENGFGVLRSVQPDGCPSLRPLAHIAAFVPGQIHLQHDDVPSNGLAPVQRDDQLGKLVPRQIGEWLLRHFCELCEARTIRAKRITRLAVSLLLQEEPLKVRGVLLREFDSLFLRYHGTVRSYLV